MNEQSSNVRGLDFHQKEIDELLREDKQEQKKAGQEMGKTNQKIHLISNGNKRGLEELGYPHQSKDIEEIAKRNQELETYVYYLKNHLQRMNLKNQELMNQVTHLKAVEGVEQGSKRDYYEIDRSADKNLRKSVRDSRLNGAKPQGKLDSSSQLGPPDRNQTAQCPDSQRTQRLQTYSSS
jgi:hypothetical protein